MEYSVDIYIDNNDTPIEVGKYFTTTQQRRIWANKKEEKSLSDFYNSIIKLSLKKC